MKTARKLMGIVVGLMSIAILLCTGYTAFGGVLDPNLASALGLGAGASLAGIINPAQIEFDGELVMSMTEAVFDNIFENPAITDIHVIEENIVARKQIAFLGTLSKITKKDTGCGTSPTSASITNSEKFWDPQPVEFWLADCASTLEETFFVWGLGKGIKRDDLTLSDYSEFIMERMQTAIQEDLLRIAWFNDTAHTDTDDSPVGTITAGVSLTDYTIIDGLWKQLYAIVAADSTKKVAITHNLNDATYANQKFNATDVTNKVAHGILQSMIDNADDRLKDAPNKQFLVTGSIYDLYKKELKSYSAIEASYELVQNGQKVLTFDGIPVIPIRFWDRTIKADFDNATTYYKPNRAVLTVKENIPIGIDSKAATGSIENFYVPQDKKTHWRGAYKVDAKVLKSYLVMVAYQ